MNSESLTKPDTSLHRRTIVAYGRLAMRELRLEAARSRRHGLQVMTFEQLATRLAGGLVQSVDHDSLRAAIQPALTKTDLGELDGIKTLPGVVRAAADTLHKAWRAGLDLQARAADHPRLWSIAELERAVLAELPASMRRPPDLVAEAMERLDHAPALFGPIEIVGITELSPCWRPLLHAIAARTPVCWKAGPRPVPDWLDRDAIAVVESGADDPKVHCISASTAYHEAIEALRWARQLIASGQAEPADIAIAAVSPGDYDDHFLSLSADANIELHFVHGVKITASREGQAAAALADVLIRGLSQTRMRRLAALLRAYPGPFQGLPEGWTRVLPPDAPLSRPEAWEQLVRRLRPEDWPDGNDHGPALLKIIELLSGGTAEAEVIGETLLSGRVLTIWRKALSAGPAASLDSTLESLRLDDGLEACATIAWMPASALAASPRPYVRLLGLNSARWPRPLSEDRLLSDHIVSTRELDPLPIDAADRRDFATIRATTARQLVLSRARRDADGRLLGRSTLLQGMPDETYLRRNRTPPHVFSETDRVMARPDEFRGLPQAVSAEACWRDWNRTELTAHDGLVRAEHPVIQAILARHQSASSLKMLLRNPLGFVWKYGLRLRAPESGVDPLVLDPLAMGDLVHMILERALRALEGDGGFAAASHGQIEPAIENATAEVAAEWEAERAVPPRIIWQRTLSDACTLGITALTFDAPMPGGRAYGEVPFGGSEPKSDGPLPWDPNAPVEIPDTGFRIAGYIDRLDLSEDGSHALVRDYKTGRTAKAGVILDGGSELQRCLYAFAVKALLGDEVAIDASLLFLRKGVDRRLEDPEGALEQLAGYLKEARARMLENGGVPGIATGDRYDELAFALPANAAAVYCRRKSEAARARLGPAAEIWEVA